VNYWKVKCAVMEHNERVRQSKALLSQVLKAEGLDPEKNYTLDDAKEEVSEQQPAPTP